MARDNKGASVDGHTNDRHWALLAHGIRRQIIVFMAGQAEPLSPADVAAGLHSQGFRIPNTDVYYHVRRLAREGAINLEDEVSAGGSLKHLYSVDAGFLALPLVAALVAGAV